MGISEVMYSYGLSVFSIIIIFLITYLQIKISKSQIRQWCILILACSLITNISIMFQIANITNYLSRIWYEAFALIGITIMPICWFFAFFNYVDKDFKFSKKNIVLFIIPIISVIATFTNDFHHLVFKSFSTFFIERKCGIVFYIMFCNMFITYFFTIIMLLRYLSKNINKYKYQLIISFIFIVIPVVILLCGNLKMISIRSYSNGIFQSLIAVIAIELLLKYQILTELPISLMNMLNIIPDGFIVINENGTILSYNKIFLNIYNLGILDIKKMNIKDLLIFKEFDTLEIEDINDIISINDYYYKKIFERNSKNLELILKYEGKIIDKKKKLFLISVIDNTLYSKDIQNIKLNNDSLIGRERLISLGQMIGGIAHNLKTPIFSVSGAIIGLEDLVLEYKESILDVSVTKEDHKDIAKDMYVWTEKINNYLVYMTDIINAIQLQVSSGNKIVKNSFTIQEIIKYINIMLKYELNYNFVNLEMNVEIDKKKKLNGNINVLIQVINNLITNAIQAYTNQDKEKKIILNILENIGNIYIEVIDFAGGISEDIKNKLFKEMVTTKGKNGTGLGLFISYTSIKTEFGGNLCFTSKIGEGTTFRIIIPENYFLRSNVIPVILL